jgi:hypothetical protein
MTAVGRCLTDPCAGLDHARQSNDTHADADCNQVAAQQLGNWVVKEGEASRRQISRGTWEAAVLIWQLWQAV